MRTWLTVLLALLAFPVRGGDDYVAERRLMVETIATMVQRFGAGAGRPSMDDRVLAALARVPRQEFVPPSLKGSAHDNRPLPIGHGQTISQPYIVAVMTDLADIRPGQSVLEIGTGSGYQAAVAAEMGGRITSIEIIEPLAREAADRLRRLGYAGIVTRIGDGYHGWPEGGPYDVILVTAAASHVPPPLVQQLKPGGRMVIPVGAPFQGQQLLMIEKQADGSLRSRQLMAVSFVPLTGRRD